ncbi:MAG: hypothetical protein V4591_03310, partial [Bdellovibrionota bacterium]
IEKIFIDGSFVENKDKPGDIDGYFCCDLYQFAKGEIQQKLNEHNQNKIWSWQPASLNGKNKIPMWHKHRIELYPDYGQPSGIKDEFGNEQIFPAAFRNTRANIPKGIIKIVRG